MEIQSELFRRRESGELGYDIDNASLGTAVGGYRSDQSGGYAQGIWQFRDLEVTVTLLKSSASSINVQENWVVPGVESSIATHDRTGSVSGGEGKKPPGWNPHVSESPINNGSY